MCHGPSYALHMENDVMEKSQSMLTMEGMYRNKQKRDTHSSAFHSEYPLLGPTPPGIDPRTTWVLVNAGCQNALRRGLKLNKEPPCRFPDAAALELACHASAANLH